MWRVVELFCDVLLLITCKPIADRLNNIPVLDARTIGYSAHKARVITLDIGPITQELVRAASAWIEQVLDVWCWERTSVALCWATQQRQWASIGVIDDSACIAHPEANYLHVHEHHVWNKDILILLVVIVIGTTSVNSRGYCDWPAIGAVNAQLTAGERYHSVFGGCICHWPLTLARRLALELRLSTGCHEIAI